MVVNEIGQLAGEDHVLNFTSGDESTEAESAAWKQLSGRTHTKASKAPTPVSVFDDQVSKSWTSEEIVGPSTDLRRVMVGLQLIARTDSPVLIVGKTGTCKEIIAYSLHGFSHLSNLPFIHVNCKLARPEEVLAALTERTSQNDPPHLPALGGSPFAEGRTVFLEDVQGLSLATQHAILDALRLAGGGMQDATSLASEGVRLIASSDFNLLDAARMGFFSDVLYRHLKTNLIAIPALRDRTEDVPMLIQRFLEQYSRNQGKPYPLLSPNAVKLLQLYPWPGNLRELWQVMTMFVALREAGRLLHENKLPPCNRPSLFRQIEEASELADIDECELIVASLLQSIALRSREFSAVLRE